MAVFLVANRRNMLVKEMEVRILMAEDDPDDRFLLKEELKETQWSEYLSIVNDGVELLDYLHQRGKYNPQNAPRPQLIILDCIMPKMNGIETLHEIRSYQQFKNIPVVFLTSSSIETEYYQNKKLDVYSYLSKPICCKDIMESAKIA